MFTSLKHYESKSELLPKRWVFFPTTSAVSTAGEISNPVAEAPTAAEMEGKVAEAEEIVRRLLEEKDYEDEAPLIASIKKLLADIKKSPDQSTRDKADDLRTRATQAVEADTLEGLAQKGLLFAPSIGVMTEAFAGIKENLNNISWGNLGNIDQVFGGIMANLAYVLDLMGLDIPWISQYLGYSAETPDTESGRIDAVRNLKETDLVDRSERPPIFTDGQISFRAGVQVYKLGYGGDKLERQEGSGWTESSSEEKEQFSYLIAYLESGKRYIDTIAPQDNQVERSNLTRILTKLQIDENKSGGKDLAKLLVDNGLTLSSEELANSNLETELSSQIEKFKKRPPESDVPAKKFEIPREWQWKWDWVKGLTEEKLITADPNYDSSKITFEKTPPGSKDKIFWRIDLDGNPNTVEMKTGDDGDFILQGAILRGLAIRNYIFTHHGDIYDSIPSLVTRIENGITKETVIKTLVQLQQQELKEHPEDPINVARAMDEHWEQFREEMGGPIAGNWLKLEIENYAEGNTNILAAVRRAGNKLNDPEPTPQAPAVASAAPATPPAAPQVPAPGTPQTSHSRQPRYSHS